MKRNSRRCPVAQRGGVTLAPSCGIPVALACVRGNFACALPRGRSRATESGHFSSPLSCLMQHSVSLASSRGGTGGALPRNRLRATFPGWLPSPLNRSTAYFVSFVCFHGTRPSAPSHDLTAPVRPLSCMLAAGCKNKKRGVINSSVDSL